jgi:signal transduction histidine kinase
VNETLWNADGTPFPVQVSVRALREGRDLRGAVLTFTDMTETRAAEASLRRALRTRDEVLAVVSHDLLNPVSTIYSTAGFLLDLELPRDEAREHLVAIKRSARRMNRLIQDLLDVARMEGGRLPVSVETFSLADVVEEAVRIHEARGKEKSVELTTRLPEEEVTLSADRDRILQVLSNLLDNALRFSSPESKVEVGGRLADRRQVVLWVSDQGPGISPEDQARLFDRFWQVKRRDRKGGAGLGLSIVKGLVEAHGGRVWVESREGKGATFFFSLPLLLPGSSSGEEAAPPRSS